MSKPAEVAQIQARSKECVNRVLADARSKKPTQVVVWYAIGGAETGVLISDGTDRVKAIGGLTAAAYDVWNT